MRKGSLLAGSLSILMLGGALYFPGCGQQPVVVDPVETIRPQVHYWDASVFPLIVEIDTNMDPHVSEEVLLAAEYWNYVIGADVFEINEEDLNEHITNGVLERPGFGVIYVQQRQLGRTANKIVLLGLTQTHYNRVSLNPLELDSAVVWMDQDLTDSDHIFTVAVHEFGHALGLEHDLDIRSIMYPYALSSGGQIMDEDIRYVRRQMHVFRNPF